MSAWILSRSLPVTDDDIREVLSDPFVTIEKLMALEASVANQDGVNSPWLPIIMAKEGEIVLNDCDAE